jgi:heme-degrading monooxygenase HmoA
MIGLFFEVIPLDGHAQNYFELAAFLRPELDKNGGVLFIDRYTSVQRPEVVLSHQLWENEEALIRWRQHTQHRAIQQAGREKHFRDYRIRIGRAIDAAQAAHAGRSIWVSYCDAPVEQAGGELFKSVYREGKFLVLADRAPAAPDASTEVKAFDVFRDYTMYDRAEAPQQYPPVARR